MSLDLLSNCRLCGHRCRVNRLAGEVGRCGAGLIPKVASFVLHQGEEPIISGAKGSGAIFFSHCSLDCVYCQNCQISQQGIGQEKSIDELADIMLKLQIGGAQNINLVSPTHYAPQIMEALSLARAKGMVLPVVYNSGGYDSIELLREIDGKIQIYLPDMKYFDDDKAYKYSGAKKYAATATAAVGEMWRQVGSGEPRDGRGLIVRHLVLPNNLSDSKAVLLFLSEIAKDIWISLMAQYSPQNRAGDYPKLSRRLTPREYGEVVEYAEELGLRNVYTQELESSDVYLPDFRKDNPFH